MPEAIEISIIPQDLRHEETILQITNALDKLDLAVTHIFDSINNRIKENGQRLNNIKERAVKIQDKLEYIQTNLSLKAVKMYSVAKYPATHIYKEYEMAITPNAQSEESINIYKSSVPIEDKFESSSSGSQTENKQYTSVNLQEKLQFYHLRPKSEKKSEDLKNKSRPKVNSVSALLPFDNIKNHYEPTPFIATSQKEDKYKIEDAPDSILQPWHSSEVESPSGYMYAPALGEVPQINVPLILPDLPGIVDDERLTIDLQSQNPIAPSSAAVTPTLKVDLPTLIPPSEQKDLAFEFKNVDLPNLVQEQPNDPDKYATPAPPPPPPPPPVLNIPETTSKNEHNPPAPPLPPPPAESRNTESKAITVTKKTPVTDDRMNLMAAIRDAGGFGRAKLKSAENTDNNDRWASASIGGDLMADLHAKLLQRRKNIIGISSDTFKRMSSMIPPPPKPNDSNDMNSATSECDSQPDVDEWDE